jgi:hypothetical protein
MRKTVSTPRSFSGHMLAAAFAAVTPIDAMAEGSAENRRQGVVQLSPVQVTATQIGRAHV